MERKAILFRFGGIGDCLALTAVAKILKGRGYYVEYCIPEVQHSLYDGLDYIIDKVRPTRRLPTLRGRDNIQEKYGWIDTDVLKRQLHEKDYLILEYRNYIENNAMWGQYPRNREHLIWNRTVNSNYQNWVDLALAWANIDPTTISDDDKRPHYKLKPEEIRWAKKTVPEDGFIAINLESSSLARVIYSQYELADMLVKNGQNVLVWRDNRWLYKNKDFTKEIKVNSVRESVALISLSKLFLSSDSGFSHLCEAIGKKQIVLYTTVPGWTRAKYYKNTKILDSKVLCSPCFIIGRFCPIIEWDVEKKGKGLSGRQKKLLKLQQDKVPAEEAAKRMNLELHGLNLALESTMKSKEALKSAEPACIKVFTAKRLYEEVQECLK